MKIKTRGKIMSNETLATLVVVFGLIVLASSWAPKVVDYHRRWYRLASAFICLDAMYFFIGQLETALHNLAHTTFWIIVILEVVTLLTWLCHINASLKRERWRNWHER